MLRLARVLVVLALAVSIGLGSARAEGSTFANSRNNLDDGSATVTVTASDTRTVPASAGPTADGPGGCWRDDGQQVPCVTDLGWWSATYDCYLMLVGPAGPDEPDRDGEGRYRCDPGPLGWGAGPTEIFLWLPLGMVGPDPAVLAAQAVDSMGLRGITVGMAPPPGTRVLVNAPLWLWVANPGADSWGPISATAAAGGVSVTATARAATVTWSMGDGSVVTCGRGVAYSSGADPATACTHTYRAPGSYAVTATTGWQVSWTASNGASGTDALQTTSAATVDVREARARITARE